MSRSGRWAIAGSLAAMVAVSGCGGGHGDRRESALYREGRQVFATAGCGHCHALAAAHARGGVGPDFDTSERLSRVQIRDQLDLGVAGMPSYRGRLTARQEDAVTEFLYEATHARR